MKCFSLFFITTLFLATSNGFLLGILRDLSPLINDLNDSITHLLKDTGGLIGHTFSTLDSIVENGLDSIEQLSKNIQDILLGCPDDPHHQECATQLRTVSQGVDLGLVRLCVNETIVRDRLSERLVQISKLRTQCMTTFTRCLKTPSVEECIRTEASTVRSSIQENEVTLQRDVESIRTEVQQCVTDKSQQVCGSLQSAIDNYKRCSGDD